MSSKRSERLQRVANHFGEGRDLASRRLAELRVAMDEADQRLGSLRSYLDGYHAEFDQVRRSGTSAAKLQNYRAFLAQLEAALEQQKQQVDHARQAFERQKDVWHKARTQVQAIEQAAQRTLDTESRAQDLAEQRQMDELSLQRFLSTRR